MQKQQCVFNVPTTRGSVSGTASLSAVGSLIETNQLIVLRDALLHVAVMVVLWQTEKQNADEMNHLACQHSGMNETLSRWKKMTRPRLQMGG